MSASVSERESRSGLSPVEALQHDGVLRAQVISGQGVGLPAKPLVCIGQILSPGDVRAELDGRKKAQVRTDSKRRVWLYHITLSLYLNVGLLEVMGPGGEEVLSHLLVEVTGVSDEGGGEQTVSGDGGHLVLEGLAGLFPSLALSG